MVTVLSAMASCRIADWKNAGPGSESKETACAWWSEGAARVRELRCQTRADHRDKIRKARPDELRKARLSVMYDSLTAFQFCSLC